MYIGLLYEPTFICTRGSWNYFLEHNIYASFVISWFLDCEKSGSFQSLTNHFRSGQSSQFSHREDREHNTILQTQPTADNSQIRTLNDQMSVMDTKFSSMETEIRGLTKTVVTLKRKVKIILNSTNYSREK